MLPFRPPPPNGAPVPGSMPPRGFAPPPMGAPGPPMVGMRGLPPRGPPPMMFPPSVRGLPSLAGLPGSVMPGMMPRPLHPMAGLGSAAPPPPGTVVVAPLVALPETGPLNVFVGKLPTDLNDSYVRHLLEKCGVVVSWKRTTDPVTSKPKGFGYCTFAGANDVLRALRLLNGFSVDSKQILVKVDAKTQAKLDEYTAAMTEKMKREEQEKDEYVQRILKELEDDRSGLMGGIQNHPESWGDLLGTQGAAKTSEDTAADSAAAQGESEEGAPVETKVQQKMILSEIEKFRLAQEQREQEMEKKRREAVRERLRREQEGEERKRRAEEQTPIEDVAAPPQPEKMKANHTPAADARDSSDKAERDTTATTQSDVKMDGDKSTDGTGDGTHASNGKPSRNERGRDRDHERRHRDRDRHKRARSYSRSRSRGRSSRSRRRERSRSRSSSSSSPSRSRSRSRERDRDRRRNRHRDRDRERGRDRDRDRDRRRRRRRHSSTVDDEPDEDRRSKRRKSSRAEDEAENVTAESEPAKKLVMDVKISLAGPKKEKTLSAPAVSLFTVEDTVEEKPVRAFVPFDFAEEERQVAAAAQERVAATVAKINGRNGDLKALIEQIPTDTKGLFAYPVDWAAVSKYAILTDKMRPWITKKVLEYLGEEDATMVKFILDKLTARAKPAAIVDELHAILDDEAEVFVKLLWRKLAFEATRASSMA